jgi:hypothetical protein
VGANVPKLDAVTALDLPWPSAAALAPAGAALAAGLASTPAGLAKSAPISSSSAENESIVAFLGMYLPFSEVRPMPRLRRVPTQNLRSWRGPPCAAGLLPRHSHVSRRHIKQIQIMKYPHQTKNDKSSITCIFNPKNPNYHNGIGTPAHSSVFRTVEQGIYRALLPR